MNGLKRIAVLPGAALVGSLSTAAAVDFEKDVFPIFEANCFECHDKQSLKGGVGLETFYHANQSSDSGEPLFVAGKPEESAVYRAITDEDPEHRMPKDRDPLASEDIATLRTWIESGAEWPDDGWRPERHWSFVPPERPELPRAGAAMLEERPGNAIDRFVAARLAKNDLSLNPEASPERLIRRLHLDVTGLPPTIEEVDAFAANPTPEHYARIVDELLASPAFGEKWAIPWLDMARYADSEGYQRDQPRSMWPYRDWVIEALNEDKPFDRFTIEQIAGDLLPDPTVEQKVATAFHRNTPTNLEAGTDPQEDHYKMIVDRVNTTGAIWLGLTVGCAQCHNHKYDPISTKEYYELFAFFNNTPMESKQQGDKMGMSGLSHIGPTMEVPLTEQDRENVEEASKEYRTFVADLRSDLMGKVESALEKNPKKKEKLSETLVKILEDDQKKPSFNQCRTIARKIIPGDRAMRVRLEKGSIRAARLRAVRQNEVRIMQEREEPRPTYVAKRGDFMSRGEKVSPDVPDSLHEFSDDLPRNRLGLAKWLVDPDNPLVARTFVNRLWLEVFGEGLVRTPRDFGSQGEAPTHPELLDWMAVAFIEDDQWSLKSALRRVLLSATYRQSIAVRPEYAKIDPDNHLWWRHPGHRFRAEIIRDQALAISGLLSDERGGVHVRPFQPSDYWRPTAGKSETHYLPSDGEDAHRRGVYTLWRRNAHYPSFANFDAPDRASCVVQRDVSNTPLQALTLLNDPVYVEMAEAFGKRIAEEGGDTLDDRLVWAFRTALAREPRESEKRLLHSAFESAKGSKDSTQAAYTEIATILLNLHETITRS